MLTTVVVVLLLLVAIESIRIGEIANYQTTSTLYTTLLNVSSDECNCRLVQMPWSLVASNYIPGNRTCQLFVSSAGNWLPIRSNPNVVLRFLNRTVIEINDLGVTRSTTSTTSTTLTTSTTSTTSTSTSTSTPISEAYVSILYKFDNTADDFYGNYNATPVNNCSYVSPGYNGRGAAVQIFRNSLQYLTVSKYMNFYNRSLSIQAWIYPLAVYVASPYADMVIYAQTSSLSPSQYMWLMLRNGNGYGAFYANDVVGSISFQANQWQHIAFTYNRSTMTQVIYYNGVADTIRSSAPPCLVTNGEQTIGKSPSSNSNLFHGYIDQLAILLGRAKSAEEILNDATLVAYYSMDSLADPGLDSGPNQMNATAVALSYGDGGRVGQSFLFNNSQSYFQVSQLVLLGRAYSPYSFAMWLRPIISVTSNGTILHVSSGSTGLDWCIPTLGLSATGRIIGQGYSSNGIVEVFGPTLTVGQWVHVALTYRAANGLRLYVNGVLYNQSAPYTYLASDQLMFATLGQSLYGSTCYHNAIQVGSYRGAIDEFYIYSRELSQADVTKLANP